MAQYEYTLGAAGERTKVKELDRTVEYTYDALYRLTGEKITAADGTVTEYTYAYDNVSNRILKTENGVETTYTYNALNQLTAETGVTYQYDDAGNLISVTSGTKSTLYAYNAENKLIRATVQEGNSVSVEEYEYDYAGNRTVKKSENDYTYYLNDVSSGLTQVLAELDADGNEKCYYTRGAEIISQERNGAISYYLTDGHGSVRQLTDSTGAVTDTYVYDAWGNLISSTGNTENSYLYCGEQLDSTTGLYYLRARYMNPSTGTFISMDTYQGSNYDPITLHKYLYANANPIANIDPSGYTSFSETLTSQQCLTILEAGFAASASFALAYYRNFMSSSIVDVLEGIVNITDYMEEWVVENISKGLVKTLTVARDYILANTKVKTELFLVGAYFEIDGRTYTDVNPTARITIQVGVIKLNMTRGVTAINRKLPLAHAEVGAMYQALMAGEGDAPARLYVTGKPVCFFCRIDVKKLALAMNLTELTIYDPSGIYYFDNDDFETVSRGGKSWRKALKE